MKRNVQKPGLPRQSTARKMRLGVMALAIGVTGAAMAGTKEAPKTSTADDRSQAQVGTASWYGGKFNGRKTASGERFDMNAFTCAHRTLPLGSWLRVTNLSNLKSIFLRVNDRGPVPRSRIVDLSRGAARILGIAGLGKVKIEPIHVGDTMTTDAENEAQLLHSLQVSLKPARIWVVPSLPALVAAR